eukprot:gene34512-41787_t
MLDIVVQAFGRLMRPTTLNSGLQQLALPKVPARKPFELNVNPRPLDDGGNGDDDKVSSKHSLLSFAEEVELSRRYKVYAFVKRKERILQTERGISSSIPLSELSTLLQISDDKLKHLVWHGEM